MKIARYGLALSLVLPMSAPAADILLITGHSNRTTPAGQLSLGDAFIKARLETVLHHQVSVLGDSASRGDMVQAAQAADLVLVMESVTSTLLVDKLKATPTPLLNCEAFIQDEMGMTPAGPPGDPGAPDQFALGVLEGQQRLRIRNAQDPLAAGFSGVVQVYSRSAALTWGKVAATATVVASLEGDTSGSVLYYYRKGTRLFDGTAAAGLRIGFFLEDDNVRGTPNAMTPEGLKLFDAAVAFALGGAVSVRGRAGTAALPPAGGAQGTERADVLGRSPAVLSSPGSSCGSWFTWAR